LGPFPSLWQIYKKNMKAHRQIVVFLLSPVQNLSLRRVFANVLGPAAPLGAGGGHVVCKIVASGQ
ncbi:MAG: hypothetical protein MSS52_02185, partial [Prevotella sp.]|nr:hypothetical protein [Prevotella sp.]MCI7650942.1 hypothetical protein [Prevotella sp.]